MTERIKVFIVDDHRMLIDGVKSMLQLDASIEVLGFSLNGEDALEQIPTMNIDVALIDINLPGMDGVTLCQKLGKAVPQTKLIALSSFNEPSFIKRMLRNGAKGYLLKNTGGEELIHAIKTVAGGEEYLGEAVQKTLVSDSLGKTSESFIPKITRREKEVLTLITEENTTKEIAEKLFISVATVETHRLHLLSKLGAKNTAGLVKIAIQKGLVD